MSITYKWSIVSMQTLPTSGNLQKVVRDVQWKVVATKDGVKRDLSAFVRLSPPSDNTFTDYNSLTEDQVLEWVKSVLDVPAIEAAVTTQFASGHQYRNPWTIPEDYEPTNSAL